jgi:hypothetical protein
VFYDGLSEDEFLVLWRKVMNKFANAAICSLLLIALPGLVSAAPISALSVLKYNGQQNFLSDNSADMLIDVGTNNKTLDTGDILLAIFDIGTIENPFSTSIGSGTQYSELTGIIALHANQVSASPYVWSFTQLTATDRSLVTSLLPSGSTVAAAVNGMAANSLIAVYNDPSNDYTRTTSSPDDGEVYVGGLPTGADVGSGPFVSENTLASTAVNGTKIWEFGLSKATDFWVATAITNSLLAAKTVNTGDFGTVNAGLSNTFNGLPGVNFLPVLATNPLTASVVVADFQANGSLEGTAGSAVYGIPASPTPFDAFDNFNANVRLTPEPSSMIGLVGLLACGVLGVLRRRCGRQQ